MKVKMLRHLKGKVNGVDMGTYIFGLEYEMEEDRAKLFIGSAMAEEVIPPPVLEEIEVELEIETEKVKRKK